MLGLIFSILLSSGVSENKIQEKQSIYAEMIYELPTEAERRKVEFIINNCPNSSRSKIDPFDVLALIRFEDKIGIPKEISNIIPAIFCVESKLQKAEGLFGDQGRALGPAQFHIAPYVTCITTQWIGYRGSYKVDNKDWRSDYLFSARCWVTNIMRIMPRIERECPDLSEYDKWKVAEANVANWVKYKNYGCKAKSKHFELLEDWKSEPICL
jgi:hypothetical protein